MSEPEDTITKTVESGAFIRTTIRKGKRRRQDTKRMKKNDKKVVLGMIGEFEVYLYPYDYPDKVFIGKFPVSTVLEVDDWRKLLQVALRIKHYSTGTYYSEPKKRKEANARKRTIQKAYNIGLNEAKKPKTSHNNLDYA